MSKSMQSIFGMALSSACLLWGYEILRSSSMAMIKSAYGSSIVLVLLMTTPLVLTFALLLQSKLLKKLGPRRTFLVFGSTAAIGILLCWFAATYCSWNPALIGLGILQECYGLLLIEQYWSHINSIMTVHEGKKLNGKIMAISTLGGISGGFSLKYLVGILGSQTMPLITVLSMIPTLAIADYCFRICPIETPRNSPTKKTKPQWAFFQDNSLLLSLLLMVGASQIYSAVVTIHFHTALQDAIPNIDEQAAWGGTFFSSLHIAALLSQLVLSPVLLRTFKPKQILWAIPILQGTIFLFAQNSSPALPAAAVAMMLFKCLDYSIFRTSKETLYIPMSFEERYIAKGWIDVLGYRFGKAVGSLGISALTSLGFSTPFILPALGFTSLCLWFQGAKKTDCNSPVLPTKNNEQEDPIPVSC